MRELKKGFTVDELSQKLKKPRHIVKYFLCNSHGSSLATTLGICRILHIKKETLFKNICLVYINHKKNGFTARQLILTKDFIEWYSCWLGEGDHSSTREAISLTNYSLDILRYHIEMLQKLGFSKDQMKVEVVSPTDDNQSIIKKRWSIYLSISQNQISTITYMKNASQEGARVQVWCAALYRILHQIEDIVKQRVKKSNDSMKIAYLRGIYAAEGSVRSKGQQIRINMNNQREIAYIKSILTDLSINSSDIKYNRFSGTYDLGITGYYNIKRFYEIKGFGLNSKRSELLKTKFQYYNKKLPYRARTEEIMHILMRQKTISNNELAEICHRHPRHIAYITRYLLNKGILYVDRSKKVYKYSLADQYLA
jgi:hypothetical protein